MALHSQEQLCKVLSTLFDHGIPALDPAEHRLVGTAASLLHGVQVTARDIDLLAKERKTVDRFHGALQPLFRCVQPPTDLPDARQYLTTYEVAGIEVELSTVEWETESDGIECLGRGPWAHFYLLPCGVHTIPTVTLELRLISELVRGRVQQYAPLIHYMRQHGCDVALIQRGMQAQGLAAAFQAEIVNQLSI